MTSILINLAVALSPVIFFLYALVHLDSFKLVRLTFVLQMLLVGVALAAVGYLINGAIAVGFSVPTADYTRFVAPVVEELLKASALMVLFAMNRIGFRVDAAIVGFAIGTGFSMAENAYLLHILSQANITVWIFRGFGTAMMHGGTTAIFAIMAQTLIEKRPKLGPIDVLPGLVLAIVLHAAFNYYPHQIALTTAASFIVLPAILLMIFAKSEEQIHTWLLNDYESHQHLMFEIESGEFVNDEAGRFIVNLASRFGGAHAEDMFEYVKLHTELVLRAESIDLERERGQRVTLTGADDAKFDRLHALEKSIGPTAMAALGPHLKFSRKELFEIHELERLARATPD
ncbi:MAG TPA: PrsW family glutamic-type intramembrane protease [Rhizomicrobium sp.]|nr:PrsW family glutamic-type intramembrane protease [Rhizomicrobium sp.]